MWMRLVPLLPILHRLGAVQHFYRAYGGAPPFAERPGTITYVELTTTDWTADPFGGSGTAPGERNRL